MASKDGKATTWNLGSRCFLSVAIGGPGIDNDRGKPNHSCCRPTAGRLITKISLGEPGSNVMRNE
jgi:hypothetical protein